MTFEKILLVGWDSADWEFARPLIDRGEMPNLEKVVAGGVMGNLASPGPAISEALWTTIATGRRISQHGVLSSLELSGDGHRVVPVTCSSRRSAAIWNMLSDDGSAAHVVGWPATQGESLARGSVISDQLPYGFAGGLEASASIRGAAVSPARLIEKMGELCVSPSEVDANMVRLFVPDAERVDQDVDFSLARLRVHVASGLTIQAAATWLLANQPWDFLAVRFGALGAISRDFMQFCLPGTVGVSERRHQLYRDVVNSAYRFHDLMLGRLMSLAGGEATVVIVSQQGRDDANSSSRAAQFLPLPSQGRTRRPGMFAARGPGLRSDELIFGASQLDVTPTLLAMRGISATAEMPGRALTEIFIEPTRMSRSTREVVPSDAVVDPKTADDQVVAILNSLKPFLENSSSANLSSDETQPRRYAILIERGWVLAQTLLAERRQCAALPLLEALFRHWPERPDFSQALAHCQLWLQMVAAAKSTTDVMLEYVENPAAVALLRAQFAHQTQDFAGALRQLDHAASLAPPTLDHQRQRVLALLALRRWKDAEQICRDAIATHPNQALVHVGLAQCWLRMGRTQSAAESASTAIGLDYEMAVAHFTQAEALWRTHQHDQAVLALQTAVRLAPDEAVYHRTLSIYYRKLGNVADADGHMALSHRLQCRKRSVVADE